MSSSEEEQYLRARREELIKDIQDIETGRLRHQTKTSGSDWKEISQELVTEYKNEVQDIDRLLSTSGA